MSFKISTVFISILLSTQVFAYEYSREFALEIFQMEFEELCTQGTNNNSSMICTTELNLNSIRRDAFDQWYVRFHPTPWRYEIYTLKYDSTIEFRYFEED